MPGFYQPAVVPAELTVLLSALPPDDAHRLFETFQFAAAAHAGQQRDEGAPFIEHPVRVAVLLWREFNRNDLDLLLAALTHDVLEDCREITPVVLGDLIGPTALDYVIAVTKPPAPIGAKDARDRAYLESLPLLSLDARLLKLADRIDNVRSVIHSPDRAKAQRYLDVTVRNFIPLAAMTDITAARLLSEATEALERHLSASPPSSARADVPPL